MGGHTPPAGPVQPLWASIWAVRASLEGDNSPLGGILAGPVASFSAPLTAGGAVVSAKIGAGRLDHRDNTGFQGFRQRRPSGQDKGKIGGDRGDFGGKNAKQNAKLFRRVCASRFRCVLSAMLAAVF